MIKQRQLTLLGHVIRAGRNDPMNQVTFATRTLEPYHPMYRRIGCPRQQWLEENMKQAWEITQPTKQEEYVDTVQQRTLIQNTAINRTEPFATKQRQIPT